MLHYLLFLPQIALITLYDWVFFANEYTLFPANCWWAFAFLHVTLMFEFVSMYFLRQMKQMPFTKKHPMWLFTIIIGIQFLLTVIFSLVSTIKLKWVIILLAFVFTTELLSLGVLLFVQKHRNKKGHNNYGEALDEDVQKEVEQDLLPPPKQIKSTSLLLLMKFLANPNSWGVPEDFYEIDELTVLASTSSQYTYNELLYLESALKLHTDALKKYIQNQSINRAKNSIFVIMDLLQEREKRINEIEENYLNSTS